MVNDNLLEHLTEHEKGITAKPTAFDLIMRSPEWEDAKNGCVKDPNSAQIIVDYFWTIEHSKKVAERISTERVVFITVPSTTGRNIIPEALARQLVKDIGYGEYIKGESVAISDNILPMKNVHRDDRPYVPRHYMLLPEAESVLRSKQIVIVEDVLSSGASAKGFAETLKRGGFAVITVVGLVGDSRLTVEPQLSGKLQKVLKNYAIENVRAKDICSVLSRGQVEIVIDQLNKARTDNERKEIARKLHGVLDDRVARLVEQDSWRRTEGRQYSTQQSSSDATYAVGVQNQSGAADSISVDPQDHRNAGAELSLKQEHQHILDTAPAYTEQIKTLVQAKESQATQLESRLESAIVRQREQVVTTRAMKPGAVASLWKGAAWEKGLRQQQTRLDTLENRLSRVRGIRTGMAGKRLHEFARKKLQRADPELVAQHDVQERERREQQARQTQENLRLAREKAQTQTQGRGRSLRREP